MKKTNLMKAGFIALLSISLFNCEKDVEFQKDIQTNDSKSLHICMEKWDTALNTKAASTKNVQWKPGQTIRVKFLNGNSYVQSKVKKYAKEWEKYANIKFDFVAASSNANIKITFKEGAYADDAGSWSYLGTEANYQSRSMHYGWFNDNTSEEDFRATTIHEFGHALGLIHEHQNPVAEINWDKEAVYAYYAGPPNNWSKAEVDHNLFKRHSKNSTNYSTYDPESIMHYSISAKHTLDGFSVGYNSRLSATDKSFIASIYPGKDINPGNSCDGIPVWSIFTSYNIGDKVQHKGNLFEKIPGDWKLLGPCDNSGSTTKKQDNIIYPGS
ncbi:M12 family metallopeptidase [Aquimarina hainanensis]|uniref:M12 family metallopeptidase n=1 Tax=Aquimarina hainanensis TaxID=1578017 RepID=A0ABW5NEJ2_9FLAO|nr:M12 family metallopeptidase [Aquimarina sp. TRL1]QKX06682.1 matrixin family metalloprotease [Aquimarina sp. TRL1]